MSVLAETSFERNHNLLNKAFRELLAPALGRFIKAKLQQKWGEDWQNHSDWLRFFNQNKSFHQGKTLNWADSYIVLKTLNDRNLWPKVFQNRNSRQGEQFDQYERSLINLLLATRNRIAHPTNSQTQKHIERFTSDYTLYVFDTLTQLLDKVSAPESEQIKAWKQEYFTKNYQDFSTVTKTGTDIGINWKSQCAALLERQKLNQLTTNTLTAETPLAREDIYIPLGVVERQVKKATPRETEEISPEEGATLYEEKLTPISNQNFFEKLETTHQSIAIIGEPGAGKTTLLQTIADWLIQETDDIPIWISLADLGEKSLGDYLQENWLRDAAQAFKTIPPEWEKGFEGLLKSGKVWLLLDGVDEMTVHSPLSTISTQLREGWVSQVRVVFTCRLNVWEANKNQLYDCKVFRNLDFSNEDIEQFIENWFNSQESQRGTALKQQLSQTGKERVQNLVKNPLRLTLLCYSWGLRAEDDLDLPLSKAGLYQWFVEAFYEWNADKIPVSLNGMQKRELNQGLGRLALEAMQGKTSRFRLREDFITTVLGERDCEDSLFWLAEQLGWLNVVGRTPESPHQKVYAFYHPTFEEYFAALAIEDWHFFLNHVPQNPQQGTYRIFDKQWKEVFLLWIGREDLSTSLRFEVLQELINFQEKPFCYHTHFIAAQAIVELDCPLTQQAIDQVIWWGFGYFNSNLKKWKSFKSWLAQESREVLKSVQHSYIEEHLVYVLLLLIETSKESTDEQEKVLLNNISKEVIFCLGHQNANHKIFIFQYKKWITHARSEWLDEVLDFLKNDNISVVHSDIIQALIQRTKALYTQLEKDNDKEINKSQAQDLYLEQDLYDQAFVEALLNSISVTNKQRLLNDFQKILDVLPSVAFGNLATIHFFENELLNQNNPYIKSLIATILNYIAPNHKKALETFNDLLYSQNEQSRVQVASSILTILPDHKVATNVLNQCLENEANSNLHGIAALSILPIQPNPKLVKVLLHELLKKDCVEDIDMEDIRALNAYKNKLVQSFSKNSKSIKILLDLIQNRTDNVSKQEIVLGLTALETVITESNYPEIINTVSHLLSIEQEKNIQYQLARILGKIDPQNTLAIQTLRQLLKNTSIENKLKLHKIATNLGEINPTDEKAIDTLLELLQDDTYIFLIVESLGKIGVANEKVIDTMLHLYISPESENDYFFRNCLKEILIGDVCKKVVSLLKNLPKSKHPSELLWHCSKHLSYPEFYQAWNHPEITPHPEVAETTGVGTTLEVLKQNLIHFSHNLHYSLSQETQLHNTICAICVDANTFINPDHPAAKLYTEMVKAGLPKASDGTPKTMVDLQTYWELLDLDPTPVLILYDTTALETEKEQLRDRLLSNLSKFTGSICAITEQKTANLQTFSPHDPQLVENVMKWIKGRQLEQ